jgi:ATP-dependent RNA helicase CshB
MSSFSAFNLSPTMVGALKKMGYVEPSPVQTAVIPKALRGISLLAQSATGSGKTHAFLVPLIEKTDMSLPRLQAIVIAPTRELAHQTYDFARQFQRYFPKFKVRLFTSESEVSQNEEGLSEAPQMAIGTPGRLKDLLVDKHLLNLQSVRSVVLDEADMLLDMGYFTDIEALFGILKEPQTMVFSATLKQNLRDELHKFVRSDFEFEGEKVETAATVRHHLVDIKHADPVDALVSFLNVRKPYLCLVFASTKELVEKCFAKLQENGVDAIFFTGSLGDRARKKAIRLIKGNEYQVIVCSDLLARGIDIEDVSDVVSIDLPSEQEFYFHRAGRTGRFGKDGDSWVFYDDDHVERAKALLDAGVPFDYFTFRNGVLAEDPVGLAPKRKLLAKKPFMSEMELKEIKIAKAESRPGKVKPAYKKKRKWAIDKVKRKYRRKAIQKKIRQELAQDHKEGGVWKNQKRDGHK